MWTLFRRSSYSSTYIGVVYGKAYSWKVKMTCVVMIILDTIIGSIVNIIEIYMSFLSYTNFIFFKHDFDLP